MSKGETFYRRIRQACPQARIVLYETWARGPGNAVYVGTNGVPDFADGIDMYGNGGANRSGNFTPIRLTVSDNFDPSQFDVSFVYSAASPSMVTRSVVSASGKAGRQASVSYSVKPKA